MDLSDEIITEKIDASVKDRVLASDAKDRLSYTEKMVQSWSR